MMFEPVNMSYTVTFYLVLCDNIPTSATFSSVISI